MCPQLKAKWIAFFEKLGCRSHSLECVVQALVVARWEDFGTVASRLLLNPLDVVIVIDCSSVEVVRGAQEPTHTDVGFQLQLGQREEVLQIFESILKQVPDQHIQVYLAFTCSTLQYASPSVAGMVQAILVPQARLYNVMDR